MIGVYGICIRTDLIDTQMHILQPIFAQRLPSYHAQGQGASTAISYVAATHPCTAEPSVHLWSAVTQDRTRDWPTTLESLRLWDMTHHIVDMSPRPRRVLDVAKVQMWQSGMRDIRSFLIIQTAIIPICSA